MLCNIGKYSFEREPAMCVILYVIMTRKIIYIRGAQIYTSVGHVKNLQCEGNNGWTNKLFIELFELLKDLFLEGNTLSNRNYEANKILYSMGMNNIKIQTFYNDCILYKKKEY